MRLIASRLVHAVALGCALVAGCAEVGGVLRADDEPSAAAAPSRVGEVGPEIFYLEDDGGRLVPVPGFRYRDFVDLFRMQEGLPVTLQPPAAVLERLGVRIDLTADRATAPVVVECTVRQTRSGWVNVPIELQGLLLSGTTRHDGPGRFVVDADPGTGGYRLWFDHAPEKGSDATHAVFLEGSLAVDRSAGSEGVSLRLPAATASFVELLSNRSAPAVVAQPSPPPQRVTTTATAKGSTTTIVGLAGDVRIRLSETASGDPGWNGVPEAAVESVVRIDGRHAFTDATIRLANLPPDRKVVRVAMPPGTLLRSVRAPSSIIGRAGTAEAPTVEIAIDRDATGASVIDLQCERPLDPSDAQPFEAVGFAVEQVESWRQWGRVSLLVEGEWRAEWSAGPGMRRVDPPAAARRQGFVAAFAYDSQPASLPVQVKPRQSRLVIEPEYRYEVGATRLEMVARLRVNASGGPATAVTVAIDPSWNVDEVGPATVVDIAAVTVDRGSVTIPLSQAVTGDTLIELRASRVIDRGATKLSWKLPAPQANLVTPAAVIVAAASDIELLPDTAASVGLVRQSAAGAARAGADSAALVYRLDLPQGSFAATRRFLARRVNATIAARVDIDETDLVVSETIRLDVVHVPLQYVELWAPRSVVDSGTLEVRQRQTLLDPFEVAEPPGEPPTALVDGESAVCLRAILVEPLLGVGELQVSFRLPVPAVPEETTVAVDVPLPLPADARIGRQAVAVQASATLAVDVRGDGWRAETRGDDGPRTWTTGKPQDALPLAVAGRQRADAAEGVVEATWLQTRLLADRREDVSTYVIGGSGGPLTIAVPTLEGVQDGSCSARLDGATIATVSRKDGSVVVELPAASMARPRILEIRTSAAVQGAGHPLARAIGLPTRVVLTAPEFPAGIAQRRFYWEITARPDEHLLGAPANWTSQQRWRLRGLAFQPLPVVSRQAIAAWIEQLAHGASGQRASTPVSEPDLMERRVVYSGVGPPGAAAVWIVPTWCLVLVCSGLALGAGLALAYRPKWRRSAVVLPSLAIVALAAAAAPGLAALAGQAAVPGIVLSIVAWVLRAIVDRPVGVELRPAAAPVSPSSMTRSLGGPPSLVVSNSSLRRNDSLTAVTKQIP